MANPLEWALNRAPSPRSRETDANSLRRRAQAHALLAERHERHRHFPKAMFDEHAWEIILVLYIMGNVPQPAVNLLEDTGTPEPNGLRWVAYLEEQSLVRQLTRSGDAQGTLVELTAEGRARVEQYLAQASDRRRAVQNTYREIAPLVSPAVRGALVAHRRWKATALIATATLIVFAAGHVGTVAALAGGLLLLVAALVAFGRWVLDNVHAT